MRPEHPVVMISSTQLDLPEHRALVRDACLGAEYHPRMMEYLPASDHDAIAASLRLVDEADVYLGIFAHRYGYVPNEHEISITQMEYERALERGIPCLMFLMHDDHRIRISDVEHGDPRSKLAALKEAIRRRHTCFEFRSPDDLRACVLISLASLRRHRYGNLEIPTADGPIHLQALESILFPDPDDFDDRHAYTTITCEASIGSDLSYSKSLTLEGTNVSSEPSSMLAVPIAVANAPARGVPEFRAYDCLAKQDLRRPRVSLHPRNVDKMILEVGMAEIRAGGRFQIRVEGSVPGLMYPKNDFDAIGLRRFRKRVGRLEYVLRSDLEPIDPRCYVFREKDMRAERIELRKTQEEGVWVLRPPILEPEMLDLGLVCYYRELK